MNPHLYELEKVITYKCNVESSEEMCAFSEQTPKERHEICLLVFLRWFD